MAALGAWTGQVGGGGARCSESGHGSITGGGPAEGRWCWEGGSASPGRRRASGGAGVLGPRRTARGVAAARPPGREERRRSGCGAWWHRGEEGRRRGGIVGIGGGPSEGHDGVHCWGRGPTRGGAASLRPLGRTRLVGRGGGARPPASTGPRIGQHGGGGRSGMLGSTLTGNGGR
ncbi:hypothetical protein SETIT_2G181300v2 [Setaria italica]|uniref:Uncharacterized protein n=1 Tax=Setaria italica TaxID=4555 RepID=A0A368Q2D0_SETIT|nr:hypothetical protein SETIT_2G181300v2 [Setaria italica]